MLLLRLIVTLSVCRMAGCDLLDLYVQHMDETMRTLTYRSSYHHPKDVASRIKRNLREEPVLRVGTFKKQRLDVDKDWYAQWKAKRKIPYKEDGLDFPNSREENLEAGQHELLGNSSRSGDRFPEELTTVVTFNSNETLDTFDIELSNEQVSPSGSNIETSFGRQSLEPATESREETTQQEGLQGGAEIEGNSQLEMIGEPDDAGAPSLFDDPVLKRVPKKYVPPRGKLAKLSRGSEYSEEEIAESRSKRSAKEYKFSRREELDDDGEVVLEWDPSDEEMVTFKITAKTLGYVGIGFNEKDHMKGADILLAWVDDHTGTVNLLVSPPPPLDLDHLRTAQQRTTR